MLLTFFMFTSKHCVKLEIIHARGSELNSTIEDVSMPV